MLTTDMELVSVDDHLVEPPDVWADRLPARCREAGPRVVELVADEDLTFYGASVHLPRGSQVWVYEGRVTPNVGLGAVAGTPLQDRNYDPVRFDQMRRGAWDPVARLADMDEDGVAVQLPFPSYPGFAGTKFLQGEDRQLAALCVRAYNDFVLDEWWAAAPDRYIPLMVLPLWDPTAAVEEIARCAAKGVRAISFPDNPAPLGLPSFWTDHWDPVLSAAAEAGLPLCMHFGTSTITPYVAPDASLAVQTVLFGMTLFNSLTELAYSGTLARHPGLQVVYSEGGIGWLPFALQRLDQVWEHYRHYPFVDPPLDPTTPPSTLVRRQVWGCFIDDPVGLEQRDHLGVDHLLWESDYPHSDGLWPLSRKRAEEVFASVPDDETLRITSANARALFRFSA